MVARVNYIKLVFFYFFRNLKFLIKKLLLLCQWFALALIEGKILFKKLIFFQFFKKIGMTAGLAPKKSEICHLPFETLFIPQNIQNLFRGLLFGENFGC